MYRSAEISECGTFRYALHREWGQGPKVLFVGCNPSTADARADDPTLRRCIRFARDWGFHGLALVNLFAYRATNPRALLDASDPIGPRNDEWISMLADRHAGHLTVACWGAAPFSDRADHVLRMLTAPCCLGLTQDRRPRHPLYVRADTRPEPFNRTEATRG